MSRYRWEIGRDQATFRTASFAAVIASFSSRTARMAPLSASRSPSSTLAVAPGSEDGRLALQPARLAVGPLRHIVGCMALGVIENKLQLVAVDLEDVLAVRRQRSPNVVRRRRDAGKVRQTKLPETRHPTRQEWAKDAGPHKRAVVIEFRGRDMEEAGTQRREPPGMEQVRPPRVLEPERTDYEDLERWR